MHAVAVLHILYEFSPVTDLASTRLTSFATVLRAYHENILKGEIHGIRSSEGQGSRSNML